MRVSILCLCVCVCSSECMPVCFSSWACELCPWQREADWKNEGCSCVCVCVWASSLDPGRPACSLFCTTMDWRCFCVLLYENGKTKQEWMEWLHLVFLSHHPVYIPLTLLPLTLIPTENVQSWACYRQIKEYWILSFYWCVPFLLPLMSFLSLFSSLCALSDHHLMFNYGSSFLLLYAR